MSPIRATYRLQFTPDFGFDDAAAIIAYLAKLGVSHLYASPYLKARPGSTHGYDIVDHNALNPELGDEQAFRRMVEALTEHKLGQVLDFVPNHMGVGGADNPFWLNVLEWGPDSEHAGWFDIEWAPDRADLSDKLLIPFLGAQYGAELEAGQLQLKFDAEAGSFAVWAYDTHKLPVSPFHYHRILGTGRAALERLGDAFANLGMWRPQGARRAADLKAELAAAVARDASLRQSVEAAVARFNGKPGEPESWLRLHRLIEDQHWRPASFRVAADDINYRRFFNIAELAGIRMELPAVFDHAHRRVFEFLKDGTIDGLRIDHIDGLLDPKAYLDQLRAKAPSPDGKEGSPFYLVVEKILGEGEPLREDWPVDGTTGYEVTNLLLGVLVDPSGEKPLSDFYRGFTGNNESFERLLRTCKKRIMDNEMASELAGLAREAARLAIHNLNTSDFTRNILRRAIREVVAQFPVYRSYIDFNAVATDEDRRVIDQAIDGAKPYASAIDPSVFEFLRAALTGDLVADRNSGFSLSAMLRFAMKLQQYSGPVMAKGLEDTAFYRYNRFIALNEVGGHPQDFGTSWAKFHAANAERARRWPRSMLGTSTHDTKRGEDTRARLAVLSEDPAGWAEAVGDWAAIIGLPRQPSGEEAPDRNDLYALFQTLVGTWPIEALGDGAAEAMPAYAERIKAAMTKAMREAKLHSSWASPNTAYEGAMLDLVDRLLVGELSRRFVPAMRTFVAPIARSGARNGIVQTVLKLTMPGMPDIYQGADLWDLSMVDPDNRRPVDYAVRTRLLEEVERALDADRQGAMADFTARWEDGRIKLAVLKSLLDLRAGHASLFETGRYQALDVAGTDADRIGAFARQEGGVTIVTAVCRFPSQGEKQPQAAIALPQDLQNRRWRDALTGVSGTGADVSTLFATLPAAVLVFAS